MENNSSKYFTNRPRQWGLRGDSGLWDDMKEKMKLVKPPSTSQELEKYLYQLFEELTGETPQRGKYIYVSKYDKGGMSKGLVCSDFWLDKGFAIIIQEYATLESNH